MKARKTKSAAVFGLLDTWRLVQAIVADPKLTASAKIVGIALLEFRNAKSGLCCPAYETIMARTGQQRKRTVVAAARRLELCGWIAIEKRKGRANRFVFDVSRVEVVPKSAPLREYPKAPPVVPKSAPELTNLTTLAPSVRESSESDFLPAGPWPSARPLEGSSGGTAVAAIDGAYVELRQVWNRPWGEDDAKVVVAYQTAVTNGATGDDILHGARAWVEAYEPKFLKKLDTWLDGQMWRQTPPKRNTTTRPSKLNLGEMMLKAGGVKRTANGYALVDGRND